MSLHCAQGDGGVASKLLPLLLLLPSDVAQCCCCCIALAPPALPSCLCCAHTSRLTSHPTHPFLPCSARVNNNAAEVLAAQCYHRMASDEPEGGKGDLKPLLREGPVKGAIAAVHTKL